MSRQGLVQAGPPGRRTLLAVAAALLAGCGGPSGQDPPMPDHAARTDDGPFSSTARLEEAARVPRGGRGRAGRPEGIGAGTGSGRFAFAQAGGSVVAPGEVRLVIRATPAQRVQVRWTTTCSLGGRTDSRVSQFVATPPVDRPLPLPFAAPERCDVAANASLDHSGTLRLRLLARRAR